MINKSLIQETISSLSDCNDVDARLIYRTVLECILDLKLDELDPDGSHIIDNGNKIEISLISAGDKYCPIFIDIDGNILDIQIGSGMEYVSGQPIKAWSDVAKTKDALNELFSDDIVVEMTLCNEKPIKWVYFITQEIDAVRTKVKYSHYSGLCFFWNKKSFKRTVFESWVSKTIKS